MNFFRLLYHKSREKLTLFAIVVIVPVYYQGFTKKFNFSVIENYFNFNFVIVY